jgi:hypothetical protein
LGAVAAVAEVAGHIRRGHGTDGLDAIVAGRRGEHVAARAADPERADPFGVDHVMAGRQVRHRGFEVPGAIVASSSPRGSPSLSP